MKKIAILSNVNVDSIIQNIRKDGSTLVYEGMGYGNVFEELKNKESSLYNFQPSIIFILIDIYELCINCYEINDIKCLFDEWFSMFTSSIDSKYSYIISDADCRRMDIEINGLGYNATDIEHLWNKRLKNVSENNTNVHRFAYKKQVEKIGKDNFYSEKLWFLGRIIHSSVARTLIIDEIYNNLNIFEGNSKKVLLLDLDNTLWGGVIGEEGQITLSNEKIGLIYKDLQRVIKKIKESGVILGIVSKNNYEDAMKVIRSHPHMILQEEDFVIKKINWSGKDLNILEIAKELNLNLDSMVFFDDNPVERELIIQSLPDVIVPDFPRNIEELPAVMGMIFEKYFKKLVITNEDKERTSQYLTNMERVNLQQNTIDFSSFLKDLQITVKSVNPIEHKERLYQLINKTNQFNLTTKRYTLNEVEDILQNENKLVYLFEISDRFGNNGITAIVIVDLIDIVNANIDTFILSCRIMGKYIENGILDIVENDLTKKGYKFVLSQFIKTEKNKPVESFYEKMGYSIIEVTDSYKKYKQNLENTETREYYFDEVIVD